VDCSSVLVRGSAVASADVVLGAGSTVAVVALTVADSLVVGPASQDAAQLAASVAALHMKQSAAERFAAVAQCAAVAASTVVVADTAAAVTAADIGNPRS
jgi:hypothetical protein